MTHIINGREIAQNLRNNIKKEISELKNKFGSVPGLAVIQVGNIAASSVYVKAKTKNAQEVENSRRTPKEAVSCRISSQSH